MSRYPLAALTGASEPSTKVAIPTKDIVPTLVTQAMGRANETGLIGVLANQACTLTIRYFSKKYAEDNTGDGWVLGSSLAAGYARAYAAAGYDFFSLPPGALFHIASSADTTDIYHDGKEVGTL